MSPAKQAEAVFRALLDALDAVVWQADPETLRFTFVSKRSTDLIGLTPEQMIADPASFVARAHPEDRQAMELLKATARDGRDRRFVHRVKDGRGRDRWFRTDVHAMDFEGRRVLVGLMLDVSERLRVERALGESSAEQRLLSEQAPVIVWTTDLEWRFTSSIGAARASVGLAGEQLLGVPLHEYFQTDDPMHPLLVAHRTAAEGHPVQLDSEWAGRVFQVRVEPFHDGHGQLIGTIGAALDITERRRAEQASERERQRFETLVNTIDGVVWEAQPGPEFTFVSAQAERLLGFPAARWIEEGFWKGRLHPEDRETALRSFDLIARFKRGHALEYRLLDAEGRAVWIHDVVSVTLESGRPVLRGVMLDVTARRRAEEERDVLLVREREVRAKAQDAERRAAFLSEASRALAVSLDFGATLERVAELAIPDFADWCIVDLIESSGQLARVAVAHRDPSKAELLQRLKETYPLDRDRETGIIEVIRSGNAGLVAEIGDELLRAAVKDVDHRKLIQELGARSAVGAPLVARDRMLGAITLFYGSSQRRYGPSDVALVEELARRAALAVDNARLYRESQEAIHARDEFLSVAAHELRTPCTSLQLGVQSLLRHARDGDASRAPAALLTSVLQTTERQSKRLSQLVDKLLDVSRLTAGKLPLDLEPVDLAAVTREVAAGFGEELAASGSTLTLSADAPVVGRWDRSRLAQVLTNLLSNSIKYGRGLPIAVRVEADGAWGRVKVTDEGIGIPPGRQRFLFQRFERAVSSRNYGGLGLGLYIVRQIVGALEGKVRLQSEPGVGTSFTVELPLTGPASETPPVASGI